MFPNFDHNDLCLGGVWRPWNGWIWWCWYFHSGWVEWVPASSHLLGNIQMGGCIHGDMPQRLLADLHNHFDVPLDDPYHMYQDQLRYDRHVVKSHWYYSTVVSYSNLDAISGPAFVASTGIWM